MAKEGQILYILDISVARLIIDGELWSREPGSVASNVVSFAAETVTWRFEPLEYC